MLIRHRVFPTTRSEHLVLHFPVHEVEVQDAILQLADDEIPEGVMGTDVMHLEGSVAEGKDLPGEQLATDPPMAARSITMSTDIVDGTSSWSGQALIGQMAAD